VYKKWWNEREKGGDGQSERMKYNRKQAADTFGADWNTKRDWADANSAAQWNDRSDAASRDAQAAR
jgi:hypothetical protein